MSEELSPEDQDFIEENVKEELAEEHEYEIELYLSTDGKQTVHYTAKTPEGRKRGLEAAMHLFDAIKRKYGTKADMWGGVMNGKKTRTEVSKVPVEETPICPQCGSEMWDNRPKKASGEYSKKSPDFKCKNEECNHAIWPKKKQITRVGGR